MREREDERVSIEVCVSVGMYCDLDHNQTNELLRRKVTENGYKAHTQSMELAYDGLSLKCKLA